MKKVFIILFLTFLGVTTYSQDAGYCKFMRLAFACADTNFALFQDPDNPWYVKPQVLQAGGFKSGELIGLQHMTLELNPSDGSNYPEAVRDSLMIASFSYLAGNIHNNCFSDLNMSMDVIRFNGKNTVLDKEQIISQYLIYFKELESGMKFPIAEGLTIAPHLQLNLLQSLENKNIYHIQYTFFTANAYKAMVGE